MLKNWAKSTTTREPTGDVKETKNLIENELIKKIIDSEGDYYSIRDFISEKKE